MQKYIWGGVGIVILILCITLGVYHSKLDKANSQIDTLNNNVYAYEQESKYMTDSLNNSRGVFMVTINELTQSKDSINKVLNAERKALNIKDNELKEALNFNTTIQRDTTVHVTVNEFGEFSVTTDYNPQTHITIDAVRDSISGLQVTTKLDMTASFQAYVAEKKFYKEPKFIKRLIQFKWGKYTQYQSYLTTNNDAIKIKDFRVIQVK